MSRNEKITLAIFILCLGIGYATLSGVGRFFGSAYVYGQVWGVHFENIQIVEGSVDAPDPIIEENETKVTCRPNLNEPGDFYEFTIDVTNTGTFDAVIDSVENTELTTSQKKYLTYEVAYADGSPIEEGDKLRIGDTVQYRVRVEFLEDIEIEDLDPNTEVLELSFEALYIRLKEEVVEP